MSKITIENVDDAVYYYPRYFDKPSEVVEESVLSRSNKIKLLKYWKLDIQLQEVAEEENMHSSEVDILDEINQALHDLASDENTEDTPPTKFGGI